LNETNIPKYFSADAVNTTYYVLKRILIRPILKKTPMSFSKVENQIFHILEFSAANASL